MPPTASRGHEGGMQRGRKKRNAAGLLSEMKSLWENKHLGNEEFLCSIQTDLPSERKQKWDPKQTKHVWERFSQLMGMVSGKQSYALEIHWSMMALTMCSPKGFISPFFFQTFYMRCLAEGSFSVKLTSEWPKQRSVSSSTTFTSCECAECWNAVQSL